MPRLHSRRCDAHTTCLDGRDARSARAAQSAADCATAGVTTVKQRTMPAPANRTPFISLRIIAALLRTKHRLQAARVSSRPCCDIHQVVPLENRTVEIAIAVLIVNTTDRCIFTTLGQLVHNSAERDGAVGRRSRCRCCSGRWWCRRLGLFCGCRSGAFGCSRACDRHRGTYYRPSARVPAPNAKNRMRL